MGIHPNREEIRKKKKLKGNCFFLCEIKKKKSLKGNKIKIKNHKEMKYSFTIPRQKS